MLDGFSCAMCSELWGRIGYARALIEVSAEKELKKEVVMAVPVVDGDGHTLEKMIVEYEWTPPQSMDCKVFGHNTKECPKRVVDHIEKVDEVDTNGFTLVKNRKNKRKKVQNRNIEGIKLSM
ncbi:hypothetical protein Tco_1272347 [Tanacetum coccineum]